MPQDAGALLDVSAIHRDGKAPIVFLHGFGSIHPLLTIFSGEKLFAGASKFRATEDKLVAWRRSRAEGRRMHLSIAAAPLREEAATA